MSCSAPPPSLATIGRNVEECLRALLDDEAQRWTTFDADLSEPIGEIARLVLAGGKRLRPAFTYWGFVGAGGDPDDPMVVRAGAAFELMHAFALFHDDVMDDAATRRGASTTHTVFAERHSQQLWAGESRRFGEGVAILVGDLAFVYADQLLQGVSAEAWAVWNELRVELNVGQILDLLGGATRDRGQDKAARICRYKSGKYTIERPLHLGAVLANSSATGSTWPSGSLATRPPDEQLIASFSAYGLPLGDAFQMRDDVMGAFGDPAITGKPVGGDLREGKPTPLLARAVELATPAQRAVLDEVGQPGLSDDDVARIQQSIVDTGALTSMEATIAALTDEALAAISNAPIIVEARDELIALAHYVSARQD